MTTTQHHHPGPAVVVGMDGSEANRSAVDWAMAHAARAQRPLSLVAVIPQPCADGRPHGLEALAAGSHATRRQLTTDLARERPGLRVHWTAEDHGPAAALVARSLGQDVLVVGRGGSSTPVPTQIGSTTAAVAELSGVPVVSVPGGWSLKSGVQESVVLGLDLETATSAVARYAFEEARRRRATLSVVAWGTAPEAGALPFAVRQLCADHPDVSVVLLPGPHDDPASRLLAASERAQLVVVGRHQHAGTATSALASIRRRVLERALAPVVVVPAGQAC